MNKSKITVRICANGFIIDMNGNESIAKDKKELSKVIGDIFVVNIERYKERKVFSFEIEARAE